MNLPDPRLQDCRRIYLRGVRLDLRIGIYPHEQQRTQRVIVHAEVWAALADCTPQRDAIEEVVDHDFIRAGIDQIAARGPINLQETLCDAIVAHCLTHPKVIAARVVTEKHEAYPDCECTGIEVFKFKESSA